MSEPTPLSDAAAMLAALKEAVEFQNEDTECLIAGDEGDYVMDHPVCPDARCKDHGCMVMRVNRWREVVAKAEGRTP